MGMDLAKLSAHMQNSTIRWVLTSRITFSKFALKSAEITKIVILDVRNQILCMIFGFLHLKSRLFAGLPSFEVLSFSKT